MIDGIDGLENIVAAETVLSEVDGQAGRLVIRGYSVEELAGQVSYEIAAHLLLDGFFDDLAPGNYVVHRQHGVARYGGMVTRTMGGSTRDYLLLEYRGGDKLYLPTDQI